MKNLKPIYHAHLITYKKALELNLYRVHIRAPLQFRSERIKVVRHLIAQHVKLDRMKKRRLAA